MIRKNKKRINPRYFLNEVRSWEDPCGKVSKDFEEIKARFQKKGQYYGTYAGKPSDQLTDDEIIRIYADRTGCVLKKIIKGEN